MSTNAIGWYGKLPSHGDFLKRRVPEAFERVWDDWLQGCIASSRTRLAGDWSDTYLTSPIWRFFIPDGVAGSTSFAGILLPSVDRVGRYFPLTIFAQLPAALSVVAVTIHGRQWLHQIEEIALRALENDQLDLEAFDRDIVASASELDELERYAPFDAGPEFPGAARHWRLPIDSVDRLPAALIDPLMQSLGRQLRPLSVWWTQGSERVSASCLLCERLPNAEQFTAMLDGNWADGGWHGELTNVLHEDEPQESLEENLEENLPIRISSAALTDVGPKRDVNQDRVVDRSDAGIWAVADGMGGHARGELASQMIADVLVSAPAAATLNASIESIRESMSRVNAELQRAARGTDEPIGSTVVALSIRHGQWAVLWAGDSRAYLLRDGGLRALSQDHSNVAEVYFDPQSPPQSSGGITRAVGGDVELDLDSSTGVVRPGDRFLLCSDGVHGTLTHSQICQTLLQPRTPEQLSADLVTASIEHGSTDNLSAVVIDVALDETH